MNWKRWKLGIFISLLLSLLVAGSGLVEGTSWRAFVAVFCSAALTHLGAWLYKHPAETIEFTELGDDRERSAVAPKGKGD